MIPAGFMDRAGGGGKIFLHCGWSESGSPPWLPYPAGQQEPPLEPTAQEAGLSGSEFLPTTTTTGITLCHSFKHITGCPPCPNTHTHTHTHARMHASKGEMIRTAHHSSLTFYTRTEPEDPGSRRTSCVPASCFSSLCGLIGLCLRHTR